MTQHSATPEHLHYTSDLFCWMNAIVNNIMAFRTWQFALNRRAAIQNMEIIACGCRRQEALETNSALSSLKSSVFFLKIVLFLRRDSCIVIQKPTYKSYKHHHPDRWQSQIRRFFNNKNHCLGAFSKFTAILIGEIGNLRI